MPLFRLLKCAASALGVLLLFASSGSAQFRGQAYVSGLTQPVAFVQDPSNAGVQFVVERAGVIRVVQGATLLSTPFLDLSGVVGSGGERGMLSLAFPPGAAESGRFFVAFVNTTGNTVVARFRRSGNPLVADPATRFDLQWSTGDRFIVHPETLHYGGNLVFGADGYLYIATGDGGEPNDATHQAQDLSKLHGKMLRLNVGVGEGDPEGFDVPADNPFVGMTPRPEIWAVGFRNPWKFSVDDPQRGGTGALLIADVGENAFEEINYEPAGHGGRNYGWRNREGANIHETSLPPAFEPLTDPIFDYNHGTGRSITGGYVYRGTSVPSMVGRYVFGDFIRGRVWSLALTRDPNTGNATASDLREHTAEITAGAAVRTISSFGVDANGELYIVNYGDGTIVSLRGSVGPAPVLAFDSPIPGSRVRQPFTLTGWALDATSPTPGIDTLHVWAYPASGAAPQFVGVASYGGSRPEIAAAYGAQFLNTGFTLPVRGLAPGDWWIVVYGLLTATQTFGTAAAVPVTIEPSGLMWVDTPGQNAVLDSTFFLGGWAVDPGAAVGTGVGTDSHLGVPGGRGRSDLRRRPAVRRQRGCREPLRAAVPELRVRHQRHAAFGNRGTSSSTR